MADNEPTPQTDSSESTARPRRRGVDVFALIAGIASVATSAYVLAGGSFLGESISFHWVIAGLAIGIGVLMLAASVRPRRENRG